MTSSHAPCFVIGTGRCGSTLLSELMHMHPDVLSLSEFFAVLGGERAFAREVVDGAELERMLFACDPLVREYLAAAPIAEVWRNVDLLRRDEISPLLLVPLPQLSDAPEQLAQALRCEVARFERAPIACQFERVFSFLARTLGRARWVERSGSSIDYADCVRRHWPRAKFVYMLRRGPECALSMSKHPVFRARVARATERNPALGVAQCLTRDVPVDRFGAYWSAALAKMQRIVDAGARQDYLVLAYENLLQDPQRELATLWRFLGVADPDQNILRSMCERIRPDAGILGLGAVERAQLERACRPGMRIVERLLSRAQPSAAHSR